MITYTVSISFFCLPSHLLSWLLPTMSFELLTRTVCTQNVIVVIFVFEALINMSYRLSHQAYIYVFKQVLVCLRDNNAMGMYMWGKDWTMSFIIYNIYQFKYTLDKYHCEISFTLSLCCPHCSEWKRWQCVNKMLQSNAGFHDQSENDSTLHRRLPIKTSWSLKKMTIQI